METIVQFVARIAPFIYGLAAIGVFFAIRGIVQATQALRVAVFGLEREDARERRRRSVNAILSLSGLSFVVYIIASVLEPNLSGVASEPTPTPVVFVTEEPTATEIRLLYPTITPTILVGADLPTSDPSINGCEILGANISNPVAGQTVAGQVTVEGQANILNFSEYKFELRGESTGGAWVVVGNYPAPVSDGFLGTWDSTSLPSGSYTLRLVVLRPDGSFPTPCEVPLLVAPSGGGAPVSP